MAQPKRKHSHQRTAKRRSHHAVEVKSLSTCPQCNEPKLPHRVCKSCGYYAGRQVINGQAE